MTNPYRGVPLISTLFRKTGPRMITLLRRLKILLNYYHLLCFSKHPKEVVSSWQNCPSYVHLARCWERKVRAVKDKQVLLLLLLDLFKSQLPCGSTGTSSGICQETATCMVPACQTPRQPPQNHTWKVDAAVVDRKMLDGQHQRMHTPGHAKPAHGGLLQKRLEGDGC